MYLLQGDSFHVGGMALLDPRSAGAFPIARERKYLLVLRKRFGLQHQVKDITTICSAHSGVSDCTSRFYDFLLDHHALNELVHQPAGLLQNRFSAPQLLSKGNLCDTCSLLVCFICCWYKKMFTNEGVEMLLTNCSVP